jgi:hypothetical protein
VTCGHLPDVPEAYTAMRQLSCLQGVVLGLINCTGMISVMSLVKSTTPDVEHAAQLIPRRCSSCPTRHGKRNFLAVSLRRLSEPERLGMAIPRVTDGFEYPNTWPRHRVCEPIDPDHRKGP